MFEVWVLRLAEPLKSNHQLDSFALQNTSITDFSLMIDKITWGCASLDLEDVGVWCSSYQARIYAGEQRSLHVCKSSRSPSVLAYSTSVEAANAEDLQPICTARTMLKGGSPEDQSYLISDSGVFGRQWVLSGCTPRRSDCTLRCLRGIKVQRVQK
jgi:hypothetical protein